MKITNKYGYPETIVKAVENDPYTKGDSEFSATGLMEPPRKRVLAIKHHDELTEDVDDGVWRLFGQLGHVLLERAGSKLNAVVEKRCFGVVDDTKVSAQFDNLSLESDGTLIDWKFTTVFGFKAGQLPKREWIGQLNIQRYLLPPELKAHVKRLAIWGILRDWRPKEFREDLYYPNKCATHLIPMYSDDSTQRFISKRIALHRAAEKDLPLCSSDDNWRWNRCNGYCTVASFCEQYQNFKKNKKETKI